MKRILVFDSADNYLFDIDPNMALSITVEEEINGVNALNVSTAQRLSKSMRILVPSHTGEWHEYVVVNDSASHDAGDRAAFGTYRAVWAMQYDLMTVYGPDVESGGEHDVGPSIAMQNALNGTSRWTVGTVGVTGEATIEMFGNSAWERMQDVVKAYGGELRQSVTVGFNKVIARQIDLLAHLGSDAPTRRFEWSRDVTGITRKAQEAPLFSRIIPVGKSDDVTIEDVNDGVRWLNDPEADLAYRVPDGSGGWEYPTQKVKFSDIDDDRELLEYSTEHITDYTRPVPTYEAGVLQYAAAGMDYTGVALGDVVQVVDRGFNEDVALRLEGRVHKILSNLMDETDVRLTIGDVGESFSLSLQRIDQALSRVKSSLDATFGDSLSSTAQYVEWLTGQMNNYINALGGWTYIVPGRGIVTYSVEVSDPAIGAEAKAAVATGNGSVTEIRGGTIRLANSLTPSGDWDWKTLLVSGHIASELVTTVQVTAGAIGSAASGNYWNLDTGEFRMASTANLGGRTVEQLISDVDATVTGVDVQFADSTSDTVAPTSGWQTNPPAWQAGHYIWQRTATTNNSGTSYSTPVMISGKNGRGIGSVTVTYGVSSSASTEPSTWSETAPTNLQNGKWLWTKTLTTYTDGTYKEAYSKSYAGTNGSAGQAATVYQLIPDTNVIIKEQGGGTTPQTIYGNGYSSTGDQIQVAYAGRFRVERGRRFASQANTVYNTVYTSTSDERRCLYNIDQNVDPTVISYRISLYAAGGTTRLLDSVTIPVIGNGNGVDSTAVTYGTSSSSDTQPSSWSSTMPTIAQGAWLWTRTVTTYTDGTSTTTYSKGYAGTDGNSVTILGSYDTLAQLQQAHPTGSLGDGYIVMGHLYVWNGNAWEDVGQIQGPAGDSVTVSAIEYAETDGSLPAASDWSSSVPVTIEQGDWLWVRTTYSDGSEAVTKSYMGTDGSDGMSVFVRSATKDDGTTTVILEDSNGGQTTLTINDGEDGANGTAGASGYVHTAWANSSNGQVDFSTTVSAGKSYLGVYTDSVQADSTNPSDYSWSLIKGASGADAYTVKLSNEAHTFAGGTTAAVAANISTDVIAYKGANRVATTIGTITGAPSGMTATVYGNGTTGAYVRVAVTASLTTRQGVLTIPVTVDGNQFTTTFSWSLALRGEDGEDGVTIRNIIYNVSSTQTMPSTGWSDTVPTVSQGKWLWTRTNYSDGSSSTSKTYVGTDGEDGKSIYVQSAEKVGKVTTIVLSDGTTSETIEISDGDDGENGVAGTNGLNGYVHTAWANSSDGSQDFSTTVSTNKRYLGVYTDNQLSDSTNYRDYSWSLIKGADGTSVTVERVEYGTSASASTQPTSWSQTTPTSIAKGRWLWVRTTYSDSSVATSKSYVGTDGEDGKSVSIQSVTKSGKVTTVILIDDSGVERSLTIRDGDDGDDGVAGSSGYVHTAWANSPDGSVDFSTSVSAGKSYLGVYTDNSQPDSQRYQDYSWSLIKGADGEQGVGVSSVEEQYYLSTSSTTTTGGSWSATQPTWQKNRYIWTRTRTTFDDGSIKYTDPVLAQALTQANSEAKSAREAVTSLDESLNQQSIFNRLTNNGQTQGLYLQNSKLYVNASYINSGALTVSSGGTEIFKADVYNGTISINTQNFKVTTTGAITATRGTIGGFTITDTSIYNQTLTLDNNGILIEEIKDYVVTEIGTIGKSQLQLESSKKGLVFNVANTTAFMGWGVWNSSMNAYDLKLVYANKSLRMDSGTFAEDTLHIACNTNFHNALAYNMWFDPNTGGANGGITDTYRFVRVNSVSSDGRLSSWNTGCMLQFKNGILVGATW